MLAITATSEIFKKFIKSIKIHFDPNGSVYEILDLMTAANVGYECVSLQKEEIENLNNKSLLNRIAPNKWIQCESINYTLNQKYLCISIVNYKDKMIEVVIELNEEKPYGQNDTREIWILTPMYFDIDNGTDFIISDYINKTAEKAICRDENLLNKINERFNKFLDSVNDDENDTDEFSAFL